MGPTWAIEWQWVSELCTEGLRKRTRAPWRGRWSRERVFVDVLFGLHWFLMHRPHLRHQILNRRGSSEAMSRLRTRGDNAIPGNLDIHGLEEL